MRGRALVSATFVAWVALPAFALVASADEGPPLPRRDAGPPLRPPVTVLRAAETTTGAIPPGAPGRELIILVGGYGSSATDKEFDLFRARAVAAGYDVKRFGGDLGTYDTFGAVDDNAVRLRDSVRSVATDYDGVHLVTHSMGGVVADRAFALGLSASDGVTSYVAWAAPHGGSRAAAAIQGTLTLSGPARDDTRALTTALFRDPDVPAVRDLARAHPQRPPAGVARLDLRMATDALVSTTDAHDPGVDSRILLPREVDEIEGHGGILRSAEAFDLTLATIRSKVVPRDERGLALRAATTAVAWTTDDRARLVLGGVCAVLLIGGISALARRALRPGLPWPPVSE